MHQVYLDAEEIIKVTARPVRAFARAIRLSL